jgi:protein phosphatase
VQTLFQSGSGSHPGKVRETNEDHHRIKLFPTPKGTLHLFAVADGMGGAAAGEQASKLAVETLTEALRVYSEALAQGQAVIPLDRAVERAFNAANRAIYRASLVHEDMAGMGTTLTACTIWDGQMVLGHVGDSRAYRYRKGHLEQLSQDHSWVAEQVSRGLLSKDDIRSYAYRNVITRALGTKSQVTPDIERVETFPGDLFFLATDGLYGLIETVELEDELARGGDLQASVDYFISLANGRGGPDNITGILFRIP